MTLAELFAKWSHSQAAERANAQAFVGDLCRALGVPEPDPSTGDASRDVYVFERDAVLRHETGPATVGKMDLYKHGCLILEAKQGSEAGSKKLGTARRDTPAWNLAMSDARGQATNYAATLDEPPVFLVACDVGYCFDLFACFDGSCQWRPFPSPRDNRIYLSQLAEHPELAERLRKVWTDPQSLDPSRQSVRVTREVASHLASVALSLEKRFERPQVARFLMRCLFTMFAEDVGLLPEHVFEKSLRELWIPHPKGFPSGVSALWADMDEGRVNMLVGKLLRFNGGLFRERTGLDLTKEELVLLLEAAQCDWSDVEPAIFGTLLERALDPIERQKLGAHYTPRAYVERLVRPTVEEPVREQWDAVRAEVRELVVSGDAKKLAEARKLVRRFYSELSSIRVLDPACGTGNFLYVTFDLFKRLEAEVLAKLKKLGEDTTAFAEGFGVTPQQFLGIEISSWAKEIAELVLWIGYLQWHFRTRGDALPPEPVIRRFHNIEHRDALLAWSGTEAVRDAAGQPVTQWDGRSLRIHPATGEEVPDEGARRAVLTYNSPQKATWPEADFIVGNPPFIGNWRMRGELGDGYVQALRATYGNVPESAEYVMYW